MARMTQMVLPKMIRRSRGVIINIGSLSGAFSSKKKIITKMHFISILNFNE
jgi:short-subunit dehydrogenase